jgi:heme exporter protein C
VTHTGSRTTRIVGAAALVLSALTVVYGLWLTPADVEMGDDVRLLYLHPPIATAMFVPVAFTAVGSLLWLVKRSVWWDLVALAGAEVGAVLVGLCLLTGSLWGRATWGTYWDWDPLLTSTALLFLMLLGYLALRQVPAEPEVRNRRSAIVGLAIAVNVPIVHFAVDWWRSLHQTATVSTLDPKIDGIQLFTFALGFLAVLTGTAWLMIHRFRLAWLEDQAEEAFLATAVAERRQEAGVAP